MLMLSMLTILAEPTTTTASVQQRMQRNSELRKTHQGTNAEDGSVQMPEYKRQQAVRSLSSSLDIMIMKETRKL